MDSIGVAVIGAGMAGRSHAFAYRNAQTVFGKEAPPVRLVAIADLNEEFAQATAHRYGFERAEDSWQALLEAPDVDAVSIVVANHLHREIAEAFLAAGKHVLCEKPLADTVENAELMVSAAQASSAVSACGFSYRRAPAVAAIASEISSGTLGNILQFDGSYWCDYASDPDSPHSWRYSGPLGSGALADLGSHLIDIAEMLCGPIAAISGANLPITIGSRPRPLGSALGHAGGIEVSSERDPVTNEDIAAFTAEFASGASGTFSISRVTRGHANDLAFSVFGSRSAARFNVSRPAEFSFVDDTLPARINGWRRIVTGGEHPYIAAGQAMPFAGVGHGVQDFFTYQARAFLDKIAGLDRLPAPATFDDGLRNLRVQEAIVQAVHSGQRQEVPQ